MAADIAELIAAIRDDRVHSASELARRGAEVLIAAAGAPLEPVAQSLRAAQPAMAPLWNLCETALRAQHAGPGAVLSACRDFVVRMESATARIAESAAAMIPEDAVVLTHSASDAVFASLRLARESKRRFRVIATESRPQCEGVELAARLRCVGIETELVIDAAMAQALDIAHVAFVGADSVSANHVVNKVGTRLLALAAREAGKPVYVLCASMKFWDREAPPSEGSKPHPAGSSRPSSPRTQPPEHFAHGVPAMADRHFLLARRFAERAAEGRVVEQRIVAEAVLPAGFVQDEAFHRGAKRAHDLRTLSHRHDAHKAARAVGHAAHPFQQQPVVGFIGRAIAGKARRINAWRAAQGVHFKAGILGEQKAVRVLSVVGGLEFGVLFEGGAGLLARRQLAKDAERLHLHTELRARQVKLAQFSGVAGGA